MSRLRLDRVLAADDPTEEIGAAWAVKELLRQLLAEHDPDRIRHKLWRFYDAAARVDMPETTRLAATIETWWPHIEVFLRLGVTNARTEGFNRIIKQVKRVGCGFRNLDNYQRRILPTSRSPDRDRQRHEEAAPLKCEEPVILELAAPIGGDDRLDEDRKVAPHLLSIAFFLRIGEIRIRGGDLILPTLHQLGRDNERSIVCAAALLVDVLLPVRPARVLDRRELFQQRCALEDRSDLVVGRHQINPLFTRFQ